MDPLWFQLMTLTSRSHLQHHSRRFIHHLDFSARPTGQKVQKAAETCRGRMNLLLWSLLHQIRHRGETKPQMFLDCSCLGGAALPPCCGGLGSHDQELLPWMEANSA